MEVVVMPMGRPLGILSPARRTQLERLAARVDRRVGELDELRGEVASVAAAAASEGASLRAIGVALGLSKASVHALVHSRTPVPDQQAGGS
jgi:hypothetical protein